MFEKLNRRWNIKSNFLVVIILTIFAIKGSAPVYINKSIFDLVGVTPDTHLLLKIPFYVIVILLGYKLLLQFIDAIFGQFRFFSFLKNSFSQVCCC